MIKIPSVFSRVHSRANLGQSCSLTVRCTKHICRFTHVSDWKTVVIVPTFRTILTLVTTYELAIWMYSIVSEYLVNYFTLYGTEFCTRLRQFFPSELLRDIFSRAMIYLWFIYFQTVNISAPWVKQQKRTVIGLVLL